MAKKLQRRMLLLVGLLSLGLISFFQGVFQPSSSSSSKNVFSQADLNGLLSVEKAEADFPYSQSYYQGSYSPPEDGVPVGDPNGSYGACPSPSPCAPAPAPGK